MKKTSLILLTVLTISITFNACKSWNKTQKGAVVGTVAGGATGAVIGRAAGNTAMGAVIGAAVGGVTGAIIGKKMDKQAEEIQKEIPGAKVERVGEGITIEFESKILFGFDNSALTDGAKSNLDKLIIILNKYPDTDIEIHGHTDSKGSEEYNQKLSERRAGAVADYLEIRQIAKSRITTKGFGELQPKYTNETENGRSQNRRVEFAITANEKMREEAEKEAEKTN